MIFDQNLQKLESYYTVRIVIEVLTIERYLKEKKMYSLECIL